MGLGQGSDDWAVLWEDLQRAPAFAAWPREALVRLAAASRMGWYEPGTRVSSVLDPGERLWLVLEGCLELSRTAPDGRRYLADLLAPPQIGGLIPMLDGRPTMWDLVVRDRSRLAVIPREAVLTELAKDAGLGLAMIQLLCFRTRIDQDRGWVTAVDSTIALVAKIILYMGRRPGLLADNGDQLPMPIIYQDIADFLGLSRSAVVREARALIAAGAVRKSYRGIVIEDAARLLAIAERQSAVHALAREYLSIRPRG